MTPHLQTMAQAMVIHMTDELGQPLGPNDWPIAVEVAEAGLRALRSDSDPVLTAIVDSIIGKSRKDEVDCADPDAPTWTPEVEA